MNEEYKILQITPCNGNWVSVGQDSDSKGYYYVPIAAWALVLYKTSEHLEEFQSVVPLIFNDGEKELTVADTGFVAYLCITDKWYNEILENPNFISQTIKPSEPQKTPVRVVSGTL